MLAEGKVWICKLVNSASKGDMPKEKLRKVFQEYYEERSFGVSRFYHSKTAGEEISMLIRIPRYADTKVGRYALIDDQQFRITLVQNVEVDGLRYHDVSLAEVDKNYELDF